MTGNQILEVAIYFAIVVALTPLLGRYMKWVFAGERTLLDPILRHLR